MHQNTEQKLTVNQQNPIQLIMSGGKPTITSNDVAAKFEKEHKNVIQAIQNLINDGEGEGGRLNFQPSSYLNSQNKQQPNYQLSRRGFIILSMRFTGQRALKWQHEIVDLFESMERKLLKYEAAGLARVDADLIDTIINENGSVAMARTLATLPPEEQQELATKGKKELLAAAKTVRQEKARAAKQKRVDEIEQQKEVIQANGCIQSAGLFNVISIDPPWPYGTEYDPETRRAANPYPEMSLDAIKALEIPAAQHCVLWLWTTHKFMRHSFSLLDTWGFRDVAILTWTKDRMGLGSWLRSQSEFCIMAVRGNPPVNLTNQTTIIHGPLREHSRKPDEFYAMVDSLCVGRKMDFFSREKREGWEQTGNDIDKF